MLKLWRLLDRFAYILLSLFFDLLVSDTQKKSGVEIFKIKGLDEFFEVFLGIDTFLKLCNWKFQVRDMI